MHFRAGGCVNGSGNIEYICFNLLGLPIIAGFFNSGICCLSMVTKISNLLYNVQYLLFEIIARRGIMSRKQKLYPYAPLPTLARPSICSINNITQIKLQSDVKHILVPD